MNVLLLGHLLLGCLLLIALLVNGLLLWLGQRLRHALSETSESLNALLLWGPVGLLSMGIGAAALAEFSLFTFRNEPDTSGISWFMLGACLMIFANVCSAFILIRLKETLSIARGTNTLEMPLLLDTPGHANEEKQAEE